MQILKSEILTNIYRPITIIAAFLLALFPGSALSAPVIINNVPAYYWYHGCGPTAAAMILGYWDLEGYDNIFDAGEDDIYLTAKVAHQISSNQHNEHYEGKDDPVDPSLWNSVADWFRTSEDPLKDGYSWSNYAAEAFDGYAAYRGYDFDSWIEPDYLFEWQDLTAEIDAKRPMMFFVDSTDDQPEADHFVAVIGYEDRGTDGLWYGFYDTWDESENSVQWERFRFIDGDNVPWSIDSATFVHPITPLPSPIPTSGLLLFSSGLLIGFVRLGRNRLFNR